MSYEIIPQAPRYEMNQCGVVRNRETGYILKWQLSKHNNKIKTLRTDAGKKIIIAAHALVTSRRNYKQNAPRACRHQQGHTLNKI